MRVRGALRRRKPRISKTTPERAQAMFDSKDALIKELTERTKRERDILVRKDPIFKFLFLDRTSPEFDEEVHGVIEDHKLFMATGFAKTHRSTKPKDFGNEENTSWPS